MVKVFFSHVRHEILKPPGCVNVFVDVLMLHHLWWSCDVWNPMKNGEIVHVNWCRISFINSMDFAHEYLLWQQVLCCLHHPVFSKSSFGKSWWFLNIEKLVLEDWRSIEKGKRYCTWRSVINRGQQGKLNVVAIWMSRVTLPIGSNMYGIFTYYIYQKKSSKCR